MSIGPLGTAASAAGSPLAQSKGPEVDRVEHQVGADRRQVYHDGQATAAGGVGEPGHRPWEEQPEPEDGSGPLRTRQSKDPSRQSGNLLDLTG